MRDLGVRVLALGAAMMAPLVVLGKGYLPVDDALRHVAKAISGRPWSEILLLRPEITLDSNPGWHWLLGAVHRWLGLGPTDLLIFSVVLAFVVFSLGPLLILRRPEAWLIALVLTIVADYALPIRLMLGRPLLVSAAVVPVVCLQWPRLVGPRPWPALVLFAVCGAASCWVHGSYYLLALPVAAVLAAGQWRAGVRLAGAFTVGVLAGAALTGRPLGHLWQTLVHGYLSMAVPRPQSGLVVEFQPFDGRSVAFFAFLALLVWRSRRADAPLPWRDPVVVLVAGCWALGYVAIRFWYDWAVPALVTLAAIEIERALEQRDHSRSRVRLLLCAGAAAVLLLSTSADLQGRWSGGRLRAFLSLQNPTHRPWLPEPGGVAYSAEMDVFYDLFFANPNAHWKYVLGFEPAIMPVEDYAVFAGIRSARGTAESYLPWLLKMRPPDRIYLRQPINQAPPIPGFEWSQPVFGLWAGRLPQPRQSAGTGTPAGAIAPTGRGPGN